MTERKRYRDCECGHPHRSHDAWVGCHRNRCWCKAYKERPRKEGQHADRD